MSGMLAVLVVAALLYIGPYLFAVQYVAPDAGAGYHAGFYLYVPSEAQQAARTGQTITMLVQPNNSGTNSDDPEVHRRDAWWTGFERHRIADQLGVVLLVPAFIRPAEDWTIYTHALDRDVLTTSRPDLSRLDLQLLAMVDQTRSLLSAEGVQTDEKLLLMGFSASGMFANRFTALHPERVKAVAAGSPGGWPIAPLSRVAEAILNYPAGIADLELLTGQPFDAAAYKRVPQLLVLGALDTNDSLDYRDGWDEEAALQVDRLFGTDPLSRWEQAQELYTIAGADVRFRLVDGVGHERVRLQPLMVEFFEQVLKGE